MIVKRIPCRKRFSKYRFYRPWVRRTFKCKCVYCKTHEVELGGMKYFELDHFIPGDVDRSLENVYSNLVYACDVCNRLKDNDWHFGDPLITGRGYLDPCKHDYDLHFRFLDDGSVEGLTPIAKYMVERLHLNRGFVVSARVTRNQKKKLPETYDAVISQTRRVLAEAKDSDERSDLRFMLSDLSAAKAQTLNWLQSISNCRRESYWKAQKQERIGVALSDAIRQARRENPRSQRH
jgi:HNH endonuclease